MVGVEVTTTTGKLLHGVLLEEPSAVEEPAVVTGNSNDVSRMINRQVSSNDVATIIFKSTKSQQH